MKTRILLFLLCLCTLSAVGQGITRPKCPVCGKLKVQCPGHAKPPQPEPKPTFTCDKCWQKFNTQAQLNAHKAKAHPAPTFNCNQCGQRFSTQTQLDMHKTNVHTFKCDLCGEKFITESQLKAHIASVHTFKCDLCGEKFTTESQLKAHMANVHTFKCDKCDQKFNTQALLDTHKTKEHPVYYDASSNSIVFGDNRYKMVEVSGGSFMMGATSEQGSDAYKNEKPAHRVTLSSYYIGQTEVTQALWQAVMGNNPSYEKGDNLPVVNVSWHECQTFIEKLNSMTDRIFRLPTETEWEFAARGGNNSRGYKYSGSNYLDDVAWYIDNSNNETHIVATKQANELGIYDMSGNVNEWCSDNQLDPIPGPRASFRVFRGGGYFQKARSCRVSFHVSDWTEVRGPALGLRLALLP